MLCSISKIACKFCLFVNQNRKRRKGRQNGGMSKGIIEVYDEDNVMGSAPRGKLTANDIEKAYVEETTSKANDSDKHATDLERQMTVSRDTGPSEAVHRFLTEALHTNEVYIMLSITQLYILTTYWLFTEPRHATAS